MIFCPFRTPIHASHRGYRGFREKVGKRPALRYCGKRKVERRGRRRVGQSNGGNLRILRRLGPIFQKMCIRGLSPRVVPRRRTSAFDHPDVNYLTLWTKCSKAMSSTSLLNQLLNWSTETSKKSVTKHTHRISRFFFSGMLELTTKRMQNQSRMVVRSKKFQSRVENRSFSLKYRNPCILWFIEERYCTLWRRRLT